MIRVTYLSQCAKTLCSEDLLKLVEQCHRNNSGRGLTGILLYGNNTFLQVIEGEDNIVDSLMEVIARDPRHSNVRILRREATGVRQFAEWSMGYQEITDRSLDQITGLRHFGLRDFNPGYLSDHQEVVEVLLEQHRMPHWDPLVREIDARDRLIVSLRRQLGEVRSANEVARLLLRAIVETSRVGSIDPKHLDMCRHILDA